MRTTMLFLAACAAAAQPQPAYEAASVKPNTSGGNGSSSNGSKGQILMTNQSLKRLIERAYSVKPFQVTGPDWMENVHFDIAAKYPPDTRNEDRPLMLRTLLEDRFKLSVHRESKEISGYALVVAKGGLKLKPVEPGGSGANSNSDGVRTGNTAIDAENAARRLGAMVVDKTGIDGVYDFELSWANEDLNSTDAGADALPSLFAVLQEKIGVRLQPQKVPVEIVVVDRVERVPTEN